MKTIYVINDYDESGDDCICLGIYATEELAITQLRRYATAVQRGDWHGATFVKWHDSDEKEVTWMKVNRKSYIDDSIHTHCFTVESNRLIETEDELSKV